MFDIYNFYDVEECSFYSLFVQKFYYEEIRNMLKVFSTFSKIVMWFLFPSILRIVLHLFYMYIVNLSYISCNEVNLIMEYSF